VYLAVAVLISTTRHPRLREEVVRVTASLSVFNRLDAGQRKVYQVIDRNLRCLKKAYRKLSGVGSHGSISVVAVCRPQACHETLDERVAWLNFCGDKKSVYIRSVDADPTTGYVSLKNARSDSSS
jgi:hypothetical protein